MPSIQDIVIIGGGINGAGIAADAAGRGLSVTLCERDDLASGTSSCSTKLIHGGLRYLENFEFSLVRKALREREILMQRAPHLIQPLEFVLPHEKHLRSAFLIRCGLFLYDHLTSRTLIPGSKSIDLSKDIRGEALQLKFYKGFSYYDCFTDDSRLVIANALSAKEHGATILTRTEFISAQRENSYWKILVKNTLTQGEYYLYAKALVNVAGPWVKHVNQSIKTSTNISIELVKGSHLIIPKLYEGNFAYILQNKDKRIIFTIPYQNQFTLIGTTDILLKDINHSHISEEEINYLCNSVNHYFKKSINVNDIVWSYSGVRCLQSQPTENPSDVTRDYKFLLESENNTQPLLTVIGGKLTTFRTLAEDALTQLQPFFPSMKPAWTASAPLPGGDFKNHDFNLFYQQLKKEYAWLPEQLLYRYAKNYGTRVYLLLDKTHHLQDLGENLGADLYQKEVDYLKHEEWAQTREDILWRRTKLGLVMQNQNILV